MKRSEAGSTMCGEARRWQDMTAAHERATALLHASD